MGKFEVRNQEIENRLREIGRGIKSTIPDGWGFTLFIFELGEGGSIFYLSNTNRSDMIEVLEEFILRQRQQ